jgi:hypothetical protein
VDPRLIQVGQDIFRGIVVCATGIRNKVLCCPGCYHIHTQLAHKREVFGMVKSMGGSHSTDFTDLTTHLIAEETGSEKYRVGWI